MSIQALTQEHIRAFEQFGRQDSPNAKVILKLFDPLGGSTWYFTELNVDRNSPDHGIGFGFVILNNWIDEAEMGYIDIFEILELRRRPGAVNRGDDLTKIRMGAADSVLVVERDIGFKIGSMTITEVSDRIKSGGHV